MTLDWILFWGWENVIEDITEPIDKTEMQMEE